MADYDGAYINATKTLAGMDLTTLVGLTYGFTMICATTSLACSLEGFINPSSIFIVTSFSAETQSTSTKRYIKCQYLALAYPGGAGLYSPNTHSVPVCIAAARAATD